MNEPNSTQPTLEESGSTVHRSRLTTGRTAVICSALGCLGWMGVVPLLDPCDQGEQLARFFAYLTNAIKIVAVGGPATILMICGWWLSRRATRLGDSQRAWICLPFLLIGTVIGTLVTLFYFVPALLHLH